MRLSGSIGALRTSARALLGEWAGDRAGPLPLVPDTLPPIVRPIAAEAIAMLLDYQGVEHARLYLHRLKRFPGKPGFDDRRIARIAALMAERMAPDDPIRLAQRVLNDSSASALRCRYRVSELIAVLPADLAAPAIDLLSLVGLSERRFTRHFSASNRFRRVRLRSEAALRRWRGLSASYRRERAWVERWLHMIDRAAAKQPAAIDAMIETATMVRGVGEAYNQSFADWHLLIDGLVKPALDGDLDVPDLAAAIGAARDAAMPDPRQASLKRAIAAIRGAAA